MKFYLLPVGQSFEYQGEHYTKSGPLTASLEGDGSNKLIPRSADIKVSSGSSSDSTDSKDIKLDQDQVIKSFTLFHDYCIGKITEITPQLDDEQVRAIKESINKAYQASLVLMQKKDDE